MIRCFRWAVVLDVHTVHSVGYLHNLVTYFQLQRLRARVFDGLGCRPEVNILGYAPDQGGLDLLNKLCAALASFWGPTDQPILPCQLSVRLLLLFWWPVAVGSSANAVKWLYITFTAMKCLLLRNLELCNCVISEFYYWFSFSMITWDIKKNVGLSEDPNTKNIAQELNNGQPRKGSCHFTLECLLFQASANMVPIWGCVVLCFVAPIRSSIV